jgi:murein L,D-transpeptidase YafK
MKVLLLAPALLLIAALAWANWPSPPVDVGAKADRIVVRKAARRLDLLSGDKVLKSYRVSLGRDPLGHKQQEGDGRTPEGAYTIDYRNAASSCHRALHISYPSKNDRGTAALAGRSPGGMIMVHGLRNGLGWVGRLHLMYDWTDGCVAVTNSEIEEIWSMVPDGTQIDLVP